MTPGSAALVPSHDSMMWPMLLSVAELGGSGSISEISDAVIKRQRYTDAQQAILQNDGPQTEIDYRLAWARSHLKAAGFERLAQRLLREADFISVNVTGRSGDGGIDGLGIYRLSLLSFPVFVQCKRYRGSVGSGAVRDFRGAMAGRGDKGLLITTGTFTADAKAESTRDGAPPVDLIDGLTVCDLQVALPLGDWGRWR
jgi:restriction endonuclease Mrr